MVLIIWIYVWLEGCEMGFAHGCVFLDLCLDGGLRDGFVHGCVFIFNFGR